MAAVAQARLHLDPAITALAAVTRSTLVHRLVQRLCFCLPGPIGRTSAVDGRASAAQKASYPLR
jgi:hypothetical protein